MFTLAEWLFDLRFMCLHKFSQEPFCCLFSTQINLFLYSIKEKKKRLKERELCTRGVVVDWSKKKDVEMCVCKKRENI